MFAATNALFTAAAVKTQFSSAGPGDSSATYRNTATWNHVLGSVSNGYLVVYVMHYSSGVAINSVSCNGFNMNPISTHVTWSDGGSYGLRAYGVANPAAGTNTIVVTMASNTYITGESVFYSNVDVSNVSSSTTSSNSSIPWSHSATVPTNGMVSHAFGSLGAPADTPTGGTIRYNYGTHYNWLTIQDTDVSTTFATISGNGRGWGAISIFLPHATIATSGEYPVPLDFIATGAIVDNNSSSTLSWSHTAAAGAWVFLWLAHFSQTGGPNTVTYDGNDITGNLLASTSYVNSTYLKLYGFQDVSGGTKNFSITQGGGNTMRYAVANSVSYTGVASVSTPAIATGTLSESFTCGTNEIIIHSFARYNGTADGQMNGVFSGGASGRNIYSAVVRSTGGRGGILINDANASTTFSLSDSNVASSIGVVITGT